MNCGTLRTGLEASAARPSACAGSGLFLGIFAGIAMPAHASQAAIEQPWMKVWNVRTAYPVAHTDRLPRPLERSP